jgi:hypothetical protein
MTKKEALLKVAGINFNAAKNVIKETPKGLMNSFRQGRSTGGLFKGVGDALGTAKFRGNQLWRSGPAGKMMIGGAGGGILGGVGGGAYGAINPGKDEKGRKKSRLKGALLGAGIGMAGGTALGVGAGASAGLFKKNPIIKSTPKVNSSLPPEQQSFIEKVKSSPIPKSSVPLKTNIEATNKAINAKNNIPTKTRIELPLSAYNQIPPKEPGKFSKLLNKIRGKHKPTPESKDSFRLIKKV